MDDIEDIEKLLEGHAIGLKPKGIRRRMVNGKNYSNRAVSGMLYALIKKGVVKKYTLNGNNDNIRYVLIKTPKEEHATHNFLFNINIPYLRRQNR